MPSRCPGPCPAIGKGVWNCTFADFPKTSRDFLYQYSGLLSPELFTALLRIDNIDTAEPAKDLFSVLSQPLEAPIKQPA